MMEREKNIENEEGRKEGENKGKMKEKKKEGREGGKGVRKEGRKGVADTYVRSGKISKCKLKKGFL